MDDPGTALHDLQREVLTGRRDHPALLRADHPVDWQGVGPHGQGGEGMMGGTPYGRMMPMPPTEGRDGLALDRLSLRLGPFLPGLPPGLVLEVGLQGDVLEEVDLLLPDLDDPPVGAPTDAAGETTDGGTGEATRLLVALAELCDLAGLGALARRAAPGGTRPRTPPGWRGSGVDWTGPGRCGPPPTGSASLDDGSDVTARWRAWLDRRRRGAHRRRCPRPRPAATRPTSPAPFAVRSSAVPG